VSNQDQPQNDPQEELQGNQSDAELETTATDGLAPEGEGDMPNDTESGEQNGLQARIEQLETELQDAKEQALRAAAEAQNARRRAEQDVEKAHKFGVEKFVSDMLPVVDNLARSIEASVTEGAEMKTITEGVELTLKSLMDGLKRHNVEQVNPEGEPFNPELHQAMTAVPQPDVEPNTVINVYQCGYTLNGRLVRPAMVVVSKAVE